MLAMSPVHLQLSTVSSNRVQTSVLLLNYISKAIVAHIWPDLLEMPCTSWELPFRMYSFSS